MQLRQRGKIIFFAVCMILIAGVGSVFFMIRQPGTLGRNIVPIPAAEVAMHATRDDCWAIIDGRVYDVSSIIERHSGGVNAIIPYCGKDGSVAFRSKNQVIDVPHSPGAHRVMNLFYIGDLIN